MGVMQVKEFSAGIWVIDYLVQQSQNRLESTEKERKQPEVTEYANCKIGNALNILMQVFDKIEGKICL